MFLMRSNAIWTFSAILAVITAAVSGLSALNADNPATSLTWTMISRFVAVLFYAVLGLTVARSSELNGSIIMTGGTRRSRVRDFLAYGILPGIALGIINYHFFFWYRSSLSVPTRFRDIKSAYDSLILSLDAAFFEETIFRLFVLSCLTFAFQHLYARLQIRWPSLVSLLPTALSMVLSSLLFAMVHDQYSFTAAFFGGMMLAAIYLRCGIEGAIGAHFVANYLFLTASYLL